MRRICKQVDAGTISNPRANFPESIKQYTPGMQTCTGRICGAGMVAKDRVFPICAKMTPEIISGGTSPLSLSLIRKWLAMPFFGGQDEPIRFETVPLTFISDQDNYQTTWNTELVKYAWLNHHNPDWRFLSDPLLNSYFYCGGGEGVYNYQEYAINVVELEVQVNRNAHIDKWYGTPDVANYGMAWLGDEKAPCSPTFFINKLRQLIHSPEPFYTHLYLSLKPGVSISGIITAIAPYPFVCIAFYPSEGDAYWSPYEMPTFLGVTPGQFYPPLQKPPLGG